MLIVKKNEQIKINFIFVDNGEVYDPTLEENPIDVTVAVVRGDNIFSAIIQNPISYLFTNTDPDPKAYIVKTANSEFSFNYTIPQNIFPGPYTILARTFKDDLELVIESRFEVKDLAYEPFPTVPLGNRSTTVNYRPSYEDINSSNMESLLLIGHGDGIELNSPIKIRSVQHAVDLLKGDISSPLLKGVYDAYGAGARNIFICAAAPMVEYVSDLDTRLISGTYLTSNNATPVSETFYQNYYNRLEQTYSILSSLDFIDIIVPLEISIIQTGGVDFITQLANYLDSFHNETGHVQIAIMGSKTDGVSPEDIEVLKQNTVLVNRLTEKSQLNQIISDKGRYIVPVYGEAIFSHPEIQDSYVNSVAAAVAGMLANNPLNVGMIRKRIPGAISLYGSNFNSSEMLEIENLGINTIYRSNKARRSQPFEVYLTNDFTLSDKDSVYSKVPQLRLVSYIASKVKDYGYNSIGKFGYDKVISSVSSMLSDLKRQKTIVDFEFKAEKDPLDKSSLILYINVISSLGLKKINLSLAAGPGA
jgi:hypothetical protein